MTRRFLIRGVCFVLVVLATAWAAQALLVRGLNRVQTSRRGVWNKAMHGEINAEILICGSSRAEAHYDPTIFKKITGKTAFDIGRDGTRQDLQLAFFKAYLAHNRAPAVIIQNVDISSLTATEHIFDPGQYIPYLSQPDLYREVVSIDNTYKGMDRFPLLGIIRYRLLVPALGGLLGIQGKEDLSDGYFPHDMSWTADFNKYKTDNPSGVVMEVDASGIRVFEESLETFLATKARVILVYSPEYHEAQTLVKNRKAIMERVKEMAGKHGVEFWDYSDDPICDNQAFFYNSQHMNRRGAESFTSELAERLQAVLAKDGKRASARR